MQEWDLKVYEEVKCKFYQICDDTVVGSYERRLKRMCTLHKELGEEEEKNGGKFPSCGQFSAAAGMQEWDL